MNSANHIEFHVDRIGIYGTEENRQVGGALQYGGLVTYSVHAQLLGGVCLGSLAGRQAGTRTPVAVGGGRRRPTPTRLADRRQITPATGSCCPPACQFVPYEKAGGRLAGRLAYTSDMMVMRDTDTADGPPPGAQRPRRRTPGICTTTLLPHHE
jgi:hypothetical protein